MIKTPGRWQVVEHGNPDDGPQAAELIDPKGKSVLCQVWDEPTVKGLREVRDRFNRLLNEREELKARMEKK